MVQPVGQDRTGRANRSHVIPMNNHLILLMNYSNYQVIKATIECANYYGQRNTTNDIRSGQKFSVIKYPVHEVKSKTKNWHTSHSNTNHQIITSYGQRNKNVTFLLAKDSLRPNIPPREVKTKTENWHTSHSNTNQHFFWQGKSESDISSSQRFFVHEYTVQ